MTHSLFPHSSHDTKNKSKKALVMGVCGWKNSGKTTLIRSLIPYFLERNLRVGVVKKTHHQFLTDTPHTDSMYYSEAGADTTVLWSEQGWRLHHYLKNPTNKEYILRQILKKMPEDILLLEGYKQSAFPKIALLADGNKDTSYLKWPFLVGVVTDKKPANLPATVTWCKKSSLACLYHLILTKGAVM